MAEKINLLEVVEAASGADRPTLAFVRLGENQTAVVPFTTDGERVRPRQRYGDESGKAGALGARLHRWERCVCPRCHSSHDDLVPSEQPRRPRPPRQLCDRCYPARLPAEARDEYLRWKAAVSPLPGADEPPFGDAPEDTPLKGPPGPWQTYCDEARRG